MKSKMRKVYEVVALAVAGACVAVYGYVMGYVHGKNDTAIDVGEEALRKHVDDILTEEDTDEIGADTQ